MKWTFENAKIKGRIVLTDSLHEDPDLLKDKTLYKFIWVDSGEWSWISIISMLF